jgi:formate-dependent nitrite reductase cytochrome c552 subunit
MDCVDCHNRPTHEFDLPENAVDKQMSGGQISTSLPYIRKKAVEVLKVNYSTRDVARQSITAEINKFYQANYPAIYQAQRTVVEQAAAEVARIYLRNIFPDMRVTWGTHPNNIGHNDSPGCFRCHDGSHTSADGQTIPNDCSTCHQVLAAGEVNPKVLTDLGMK